MENEQIKFLSLLWMGFSEEFFKEKIGSGSEFKKLEQDGIVIKRKYLYELSNSEEMYIKIKKDEKEDFLNDIINNYYLTMINDERRFNLNSIIDNLLLYLQLSSAYYELEKYDLAIENILKVAKKMVYWGMKNELKSFLGKFDNVQINLKNRRWIEYLLAFSDVIIGYNPKIDKQKIEIILTTYEEKDELGFEIRNLNAIYTRKYKKDIDLAIKIHEENIGIMSELLIGNKEENLNIHIGRNYENLSLCYKVLGDIDSAIKNIEIAEQYIEHSNDKYEICKFYCNFLNIIMNTNKHEKMFMRYSELSLNILKEFNYPDLLRNIQNLFADYFLKKCNSIDEYVRLKIDVFELDSMLYKEFFVMDFIGVLNTLSKEFNRIIIKNTEELDVLMTYLNENGFLNESYIIECIKCKIKKERYDTIFDKIENEGLKKIFKLKFESI
ncbi:hypothetical protein [Clostridium mediterraneense]|uniref:hypothetical protein n=1 Tax=Clostridium mediterraneense TaxID=1805472 RepID=UPI000834D522|nr:hypothetical protein [Clostridium mediterraneense]